MAIGDWVTLEQINAGRPLGPGEFIDVHGVRCHDLVWQSPETRTTLPRSNRTTALCRVHNHKRKLPMENQHKLIAGYRDLSVEEIALMNEIKALASAVGEAVERVAKAPGIDGRWVAVGKTDLQKGFMAVIRGIAQPTTF